MSMGVYGFGQGMGAFCGYGYGSGGVGQGVETMSRGERIVACLDSDQDGGLSIAELADSRRGSKMTLERFARIDTNGDSKLDAAEIDAMKRGRGGGAGREIAMRARWLAERAEPAQAETDLSAQVIGLLDSDGSGRLNSEEIAGTRLAELIGGDFYRLDADRNGGLDQQELALFLAEHLTESVTDPVGDTEASEAALVPTTSGFEASVLNAFDTALQLLQIAPETPAAGVVASLYKDVTAALGIS